MVRKKTSLLAPLLAGAALLTGALSAQAADYPTKPIRIVVPYAAGGSTDVLARLIGERLGKLLGGVIVSFQQIDTVAAGQAVASPMRRLGM